MVVRPHDDPLRIEVQDVRPGTFPLQIGVVDDRHLLFVEVDGGGVALVRGRNVHVPGDPEEELRVLPDQLAQAVGRLGDEARGVDLLVVSLAASRPAGRGRRRSSADRGESASAFVSQETRPSESCVR